MQQERICNALQEHLSAALRPFHASSVNEHSILRVDGKNFVAWSAEMTTFGRDTNALQYQNKQPKTNIRKQNNA